MCQAKWRTDGQRPVKLLFARPPGHTAWLWASPSPFLSSLLMPKTKRSRMYCMMSNALFLGLKLCNSVAVSITAACIALTNRETSVFESGAARQTPEMGLAVGHQRRRPDTGIEVYGAGDRANLAHGNSGSRLHLAEPVCFACAGYYWQH